MCSPPKSIRLLCGFVALTCCAAVEAAPAARAERPNFLVILVDDLGATDLGCFGSTFYETPHIDRLAAEGMRFTAAYSSCPVCSPSRASLYTGRYPQRTGITDYINGRGANQPEKWSRNTRLLPAPYADRLALDEITLAEALQRAGYATFFAGKWHLGPQGFWPEDQGFDVNLGGCDWGAPKSYFSPYGNPRLQDGPPGEHLPARLADETCRFIESNRDKPFLAILSFYSVHIPLQGDPEAIAKYERKASMLRTDEPDFEGEGRHRTRVVQNHPTYAAMVEAMDEAVGKVLDELERLKLSGRTFVLFTSDNGGLATAEGHPTANRPLRAGKGWMYEGGIRTPTIIRWPEVIKPADCGAPISSIDIFPTVLEAAGADGPPSGQIDGRSLMSLLRGEPFSRGEPLFWDYPHYGNQGGEPASAVRDGPWKLIHWRDSDDFELYNLENDPGEETNAAHAHPEVVRRLRDTLDQWLRSVEARAPTINPNYREAGS